MQCYQTKQRMTQEEILDKSLQYLRDNDEGSFSYYKDEDNSIKFLPYLKNIGVQEIDLLKTIIHLANDNYIEITPQVENLQGHYPRQIKITSQGKIFINKGGYDNEIQKERKNNRRFWIPIIISICAIGISIFSYILNYNANHSDISLTYDKLISAIFRDTTGKKKFFGFQRATIVNEGGRPVTLRGFRPNEDLGLFLLTKDGSNKLLKDKVNFKIFLISDTLTSENLFSKQNNLSSFQDQGLERLSMINKVIKPGEISTISLGIVLDLFSDTTKHYSSMVLCGQLFFSNGQKIDFGSGGDIGRQ